MHSVAMHNVGMDARQMRDGWRMADGGWMRMYDRVSD